MKNERANLMKVIKNVEQIKKDNPKSVIEKEGGVFPNTNNREMVVRLG